MLKSANHRLQLGMALCLGVFLVPPAGAQESLEGLVLLEEIIVTAQKREQSLEEVPISISVMPGEQLQAQGFNNLEEIATFIPGVIAEQGATGITSTVTIRGVFSAGANTAFEQSAAVFNDGTYYGRPLQSVAGIYDVQQVEVLFGPQPVYFGQSAIAGLVSYKSNRPEPGAMDGYAFAEAGNLAHRKMEGALTVPLGESWAARVGGKFQETDGWMTDQYSGEDGNASENTAYRVSLAGGAGDLSAFLKHEGFKQITSGFNTDDAVCNPQAAQAGFLALCANARAAGFAAYEYDRNLSRGGAVSAHSLPQARAPAGNLDLSQLSIFDHAELGADVDGTNSLLELTYDLADDIRVTALSGFSQYESLAMEDFDRSPFANLGFPNREEYDQFSQELRVQSGGDGDLQWMAGVYYQDQELDFSSDIISALPNPMGPSGTNAVQFNEEAKYLSAFASATYNFGEQWALDVGARWQQVKKDAYLWEIDSYLTDASGNRITNTGPRTPTGARLTVVPNGTAPADYSGLIPMMVAGDRCLGETPNGDDCAATHSPIRLAAWGGDTSLKRTDRDFTPDIALRWNFSDAGSLFARYVEGFKAGGFSRGSSSFIVSTKGAYDPEQARSVELGGRFSFLDDRLRWNLVAYRTKYKNQQVAAGFIDPVSGASFFIFINAAESTIQGLETDLTFAAENGFFAKWSLALNDTKYDSFANAECLHSERLAGDCDPNGRTIDLSGTEFDGLPDWTMSVSLGYDFDLGRDLGMLLSVDGAIYDDWDNTRPSQRTFQEHREQDGFSVWNLRAALYSKDRRWEVAAWGRNVTDKLYWLRQPGGVGIFGTADANASRPATYGLSVRYNLGES